MCLNLKTSRKLDKINSATVLGIHFDIPGCLEKYEYEEQMNDPFGRTRTPKGEQGINNENKITDTRPRSRIEDVDILIQLGIEEGDSSVVEEAQIEIDKLEKSVEALRLETLLSGPYDRNNAIISIHAGAGGTEAMDWASMLLRMYTRWSESKGYQVETLDLLSGEEAGVKSVTLWTTGKMPMVI